MFPSEIQPPGDFMFNANFLSIKRETSLITGFLFKPSVGYRLPEDTKFSRTCSPQIPEVNIHTSGEISHNQKDPEYIHSYSDDFTYLSLVILKTIKEDAILELVGLGLFCYYRSINHICTIRL